VSLAVLRMPPLTDERSPVASLDSPTPIEDSSFSVALLSPPSSEEYFPFALFPCPASGEGDADWADLAPWLSGFVDEAQAPRVGW
jgi:hypothetical protein